MTINKINASIEVGMKTYSTSSLNHYGKLYMTEDEVKKLLTCGEVGGKGTRNVEIITYGISLDDFLNIQMNLTATPQIWKKGGGWLDASRDEVMKYLNPNNFRKGSNMYQFLDLSAVAGVSVDEINEYLSDKGILAGHALAYLNAAKSIM